MTKKYDVLQETDSGKGSAVQSPIELCEIEQKRQKDSEEMVAFPAEPHSIENSGDSDDCGVLNNSFKPVGGLGGERTEDHIRISFDSLELSDKEIKVVEMYQGCIQYLTSDDTFMYLHNPRPADFGERIMLMMTQPLKPQISDKNDDKKSDISNFSLSSKLMSDLTSNAERASETQSSMSRRLRPRQRKGVFKMDKNVSKKSLTTLKTQVSLSPPTSPTKQAENDCEMYAGAATKFTQLEGDSDVVLGSVTISRARASSTKVD
eukprot:gene11566-480_t